MYLQTYLNMAYYRLEEQKKEAGRITNKELQKKVAMNNKYILSLIYKYMYTFTSLFYLKLINIMYILFLYKRNN